MLSERLTKTIYSRRKVWEDLMEALDVHFVKTDAPSNVNITSKKVQENAKY